MHLARIHLVNFKNYAEQHFEFDPRMNVITGDNGVGKTNLLDAVYFLCMTKSFFGGTDKHVLRTGAPFMRLQGHFFKDDSAYEITATLPPARKKAVTVNGKAYDRLADHIGRFPVVMMAPDDTRLVTGGSEDRRRFADNTLSQKNPTYLSQLLQYNRLLKQRNALLKAPERFDIHLLQSYNRQLVEPANAIFAARRKWIEAISPLFNAYYRHIARAEESVRIAYRSQLTEAPLDVLLDRHLERDRAFEHTTAGIHRDDLDFFLDDRPVKRFASQGQRKSFVLALKLAQYRYLTRAGTVRPILLLDDIFDKLDRHRARHLIQLVSGEDFGQVFITDTHPTRVKELVQPPFASIPIERQEEE